MNHMTGVLVVVCRIAVATSLAAPPVACGADNPDASQPLVPLAQMLSIDWKKGPDLPQGFQDSCGGVIGHTLVTACGFCQGKQQIASKPGRYPRGFLKKVWGLDLENPSKGWTRLPDFPGAARQALCGIIVDGQLYCWGGYSYSAPYCYRDGFRLTCKQDQWAWDSLPDLPWPTGDSGISVMGSKIYVAGGADYDTNKFYTNSDRAGKVKGLGTRLLAIDTKDLRPGWKELSPCPGTPRWGEATAVVAGKLYLFGGGTGFDNPTGTYATVVDNWRYDPATDSWRRLANLPIASSVFPSGQIVVFDRYLVLIGGCQYGHVIGPDGSVKPVYGKPFRRYPDRDCFSDVFVYDTKRDRFGTATPLPLNDCRPMIVTAGDHIHLLGGETFGAVVEGEPFAHHPDLYLVGTIRAIAH
jgi:hypothetical protein